MSSSEGESRTEPRQAKRKRNAEAPDARTRRKKDEDDPKEEVPPEPPGKSLDARPRRRAAKKKPWQESDTEESVYESDASVKGYEENESACQECHGGGTVVCCDVCAKAYHVMCLPPTEYPLEESWVCPSCSDSTDGLLLKRGIDLAAIQNQLSQPPILDDDPITPPPTHMATAGEPGSKIHIGALHQTPGVPRLFLEAAECGINYGEVLSAIKGTRARVSCRYERRINECRLIFSKVKWDAAIGRKEQQFASDANVVEPSGLDDFYERVKSMWPSSNHWPYSDEFALKLLHYTDFDGVRAMNLIADPSFHFEAVCDPPLRPYMNKWRPRDRRGSIPTAPFPTYQYFGR